MTNVVSFPLSPHQRKVSVFTCTTCTGASFYINTAGCVTCTKCDSDVAKLEELLEYVLSDDTELPRLFTVI